MSKERIMQYLPEYYQNSKVMGAIADAQGTELELLYTALDEILAQFFIDTATWGLNLWDEFLGLKTEAYSIEERRRLLKSKLIMQPPVTRERFKKLLDGVADSVDVIEHYGECNFEVVLLVKTNLRTAFEKILEQIEDNKPAHLDYRIILGFLHELQAMVAFNRWFSEILKLCGTVDVSGEEVVTTLGRRYRENASGDKWAWLSVPFIKASPTTFPVASGLRYEVNLTEHIVSFFSIVLLKVSETTYCGMEVVA